MSSTRHADPNAPLSQERYMSSPEYAELRGISGNAVTAKAALMAHPAKRSLLFFLQAMSLKPGGLQKFCRDFLAMFPDRIGTPTMHTLPNPGTEPYPSEIASKIDDELTGNARRKFLYGTDDYQAERTPFQVERCTYEYLFSQCQYAAEHLDQFIIELCINPRIQFTAPGEDHESIERERIDATDAYSEISSMDFKKASISYFHDVIGALFEYKRRYEENVRRNFVLTEVGQHVFDTLDVALATGKMVGVEGNSGIGKTAATEAWCDLHLGEARFVSLSGISHKTGVFRAIAKALGLASSYTNTATKMQGRIEDVLQRSQIVLILDEAHFLFSSSERVYSRPELIDWVNTALVNHHVPCGMVCTPQFLIRMKRVEDQTSWNADQLKRRFKRFKVLPIKPRTQDLEAVARMLLPNSEDETINMIVGYALTSKRHMPAVVDAIDEAKLLVKRAGRTKVTFDDVDRAITEYCAKSYDAMEPRSENEKPGRRQGRLARPLATDDEPSCIEASQNDRVSNPAPVTGRKTNLTGLAPVGTSRLKSQGPRVPGHAVAEV